MESIGWSARLSSSFHPHAFNPYIIQITTTIITPTPLVAANFIILGHVITRLGSRYSRLSARWYNLLFVSCAVGGATASRAVHRDEDPSKGGNIMLGGIVFQLVAIVVYVTHTTEFLLRYIKDKPLHKDYTAHRGPTDLRMMLLLSGMSFMTVCIFIRSIYRTIELSDGWKGKIISTQVLFNVLDGAMITLAMFTLNAVHPGILLRGGGGGDESDTETAHGDEMTELPGKQSQKSQ